MNAFMTWLGSNATAIGVLIAVLPIVWAAVQFLLVRRAQESRRRFRTYHNLIKQLVEREGPNVPMRLDSQIAVIFELRNFGQYAPVTLRILRGLRSDWKTYGPADKRARLFEELDLAVAHLEARSFVQWTRKFLAVALVPGMWVLAIAIVLLALLATGSSVAKEQMVLFESAVAGPSSEPITIRAMEYKGLLGDYIGGVWGTAIGAVTLIAVLLTWRAARWTDYRSRSYQIFSEMLRSHEEIVSSIELSGAKGREALAIILSEFYFIYGLVKFASSVGGRNWSLKDRIDIAYTFLYFGPRQQAHIILQRYGGDALKEIGDGISREREENERRKPPRDDRTFKGHQIRLSQYFRNLFIAYRFLEDSDLSENERRDLGKILRAKLSNYEQALLCLNCISHLGRTWTSSGLMERYMPVKNVPENFFSFDDDFNLKEQFSSVEFEWEQTG